MNLYYLADALCLVFTREYFSHQTWWRPLRFTVNLLLIFKVTSSGSVWDFTVCVFLVCSWRVFVCFIPVSSVRGSFIHMLNSLTLLKWTSICFVRYCFLAPQPTLLKYIIVFKTYLFIRFTADKYFIIWRLFRQPLKVFCE